MSLVRRNDLARLFEVDVSHIHRLVKEGMPQAGRAKYHLGDCLLWYLKYLKTKVKLRQWALSDEKLQSGRDAHLKLLRAKAELKELKLMRERGEFAAVTHFEKMVTEMVVTTEARILALPAAVAPQLVGKDRLVIESLLEKQLKYTLLALSGNGHKQHPNGNPPKVAEQH
jgi:phage terminase Nu1 subunit (DNA packaging protein)